MALGRLYLVTNDFFTLIILVDCNLTFVNKHKPMP